MVTETVGSSSRCLKGHCSRYSGLSVQNCEHSQLGIEKTHTGLEIRMAPGVPWPCGTAAASPVAQSQDGCLWLFTPPTSVTLPSVENSLCTAELREVGLVSPEAYFMR